MNSIEKLAWRPRGLQYCRSLVPTLKMDELAILEAEASEFERDREVDRILSSFKYNPYDILGVDIKVMTEKYALFSKPLIPV